MTQEYAYDSDGHKILLRNLDAREVKFIAGAWRFQDKLCKEIKIIRGKEFILGKKLDIKEPNGFTYYTANPLGENCCGKYEVKMSMVASNLGPYWAYGNTVPEARAFLAVKLFDLYQDEINNKMRRENHIV